MKLSPNSCWDCRFLIQNENDLPDGVAERYHPELPVPYCVIHQKVIETPSISQCQCGIIKSELEEE